MGLEPTTFCMANGSNRSLPFAPFAQTPSLQRFLSKRANATEPERTPNVAILATESGADRFALVGAGHNRVSRNVFTGSGRADLALATGSGGNCFTVNVVRGTLPRRLQSKGCAGVSPTGDASVASLLTRAVRVMVRETIRRGRPPA
jgi:hypothetical protein